MATDLTRLNAGVDLPKDVASEILDKASHTSAIMSVSRKITLPGNGVTIPVVTGNAVADWVGEAQEIGTSRPSFGTKDVTAYKLGVIVPFSREFTRDAASLYDAAVDMLPSALALKFDKTVAGGGAPGSNFDTLDGATGKVVDGTSTGADLLDIVTTVARGNAEVSHWVTSPVLHALLLGATDNTGRPLFVPNMDSQSVGAVYGAPIHRVAEVLAAGALETDPKTIGLAGDFRNHAVYGVVENVQLRTSDQATINDGGTTLNLFQRDMVAVRAVIEVGFRVTDPTKFIKITDK